VDPTIMICQADISKCQEIMDNAYVDIICD